MRTFIITLALFSVTPSIAYDGSKNEIETEILNHAVIPCATLASLVGIQEVSDYRPDLTAKQHGEISLHSLVESISKGVASVLRSRLVGLLCSLMEVPVPEGLPSLGLHVDS